jgi:hypothetical protein
MAACGHPLAAGEQMALATDKAFLLSPRHLPQRL